MIRSKLRQSISWEELRLFPVGHKYVQLRMSVVLSGDAEPAYAVIELLDPTADEERIGMVAVPLDHTTSVAEWTAIAGEAIREAYRHLSPF